MEHFYQDLQKEILQFCNSKVHFDKVKQQLYNYEVHLEALKLLGYSPLQVSFVRWQYWRDFLASCFLAPFYKSEVYQYEATARHLVETSLVRTQARCRQMLIVVRSQLFADHWDNVWTKHGCKSVCPPSFFILSSKRSWDGQIRSWRRSMSSSLIYIARDTDVQKKLIATCSKKNMVCERHVLIFQELHPVYVYTHVLNIET